MVHAYVQRAIADGTRPARLPPRRRAVQVRVGRGRRADPAPARPTAEPPDGRPDAVRPLLRAGRSASRLTGGPRPRRRGPRDRLERRRPGASATRWSRGSTAPATTSRSSRCRRGAPSASSSGPGSRSSSSTSPTTRSRSARWRRTWPRSGADVVHTHMYRADTVGDPGGHGARRDRPPPAVRRLDRPLEPRPLERGPRRCSRGLTPHMDRLIAVSRSIERKLHRGGPGRDPGATSSTTASTSSATTTRSRAARCRDEYGMEPGSQIVGVVARLEPEKGHPTLFEAWPIVLRAVPDAYLLVVGEGSRRDALEAQARELRIAHRVVFTGRRDDVPAVTAALDVAVLPSYREAQGLTILEAMALSRPVVASDVGGIPEMIEDGVTGLLVPPHDAGGAGRRDHPAADGPPARRHARAGRPRPRPRPVLHRADGPRRSRRSTTRAPASCARPRWPRPARTFVPVRARTGARSIRR